MPSEFATSRTVEFAETDMAGLMHFSNYFRWMEACETAFYRSLGLPLSAFSSTEVLAWPRVKVECHYRAPLRFNDTVEIKLFVRRIGARSITYVFQFRNDGIVTAQGEVSIVCVTGEPGKAGQLLARPIPDEIRSKLQEAPAAAYADQESPAKPGK